MNNSIQTIGVPYDGMVPSPNIAYAIALAKWLNVSLKIFVIKNSPSWKSFTENYSEEAAITMQTAFINAVRQQYGDEVSITQETESSFLNYQEEGLCMVSNQLASTMIHTAIIAPQCETTVFRPCKGNIIIPFGSDDAKAAIRALRVAQQLLAPGDEVVLYHTTWRDTSLADEAPPEQHMNAQAKETLSQIIQAASAMDIKHRTIIRMDASVATGIITTALQYNAGLILMTRRKEVLIGGYPYEVLKISKNTLPILILPGVVS